MRLRTVVPLLVLGVVALALWLLVPWGTVVHWAAGAQRGFQDGMAKALLAIQSGEPGAVWTLCLATAAYGFVHALGPGHGKVLLGGAALASGATLKRMTVLTLASSLAQAGTAIALVGALVVALGVTTQQIGPLADNWLAPASYAAIAGIGAYLVIRGLRQWRPKARHVLGCDNHGSDDHSACCGHAHGPELSDVEALSSFRDAAMLVASIAIRPCTGALFVLVIALRFDVFWVGALAVVTMGLGTAAFNLIVAWSGVAARRLSSVQAASGDDIQRISAGVQIFGGAFIMLVCLLWLASFMA